MSIYVSTTFLKDNSSIIDAVKILVENNIRNIELGSTHKYEEDIKKKLRQYDCNYIVHNYFPPSRESIILNIASDDEIIRKKSLDFMKKAIDFSIDIGAKVYTLHPGFLVNPIGSSSSKNNYDFEFDCKKSNKDYDSIMEIFENSLKQLIHYIKSKTINIAIETQGSYYKKDLVLFRDQNEYIDLINKYNNPQVGINLNLAHIKLASKVYNYDIDEFVKKIGDKIFLIEVSHNNGFNDSHRELKQNGWYLKLLKKINIDKIPIIFEGRNISIENVLKSYNILKDI